MRYALLFVACSLYGQPPITGTPSELATLRYIDVKVGDGAPAAPGKEFTVHYTGWLRDGTKFDSSRDRSEPLKFVQGRRMVIAGWDVGFEGMKVGGQRRLFIPYQFAYGELGRGPTIPPKAELIFDVELLDVKDAPPAPAAAAEVLFPLTELEAHVLALAKAVPEEKYGWRPAPGVRSFREVFLHIAYGNRLMLDISNGLKGEEFEKRAQKQLGTDEKADLSKADVIAKLTESFADLRSALEAERPQTLSRDVNVFGADTTRRSVLVGVDTHIAEHLGQAIGYARMNGIVPPWSK